VKTIINGVIHYTGNVQNNLYHGKGILHMIDINLVIDGEFYKNNLVSIYSITFNKQKITINTNTDKYDILKSFTDFLLKLSDKNKTNETNETNETNTINMININE
jgi:hypothetical protein